MNHQSLTDVRRLLAILIFSHKLLRTVRLTELHLHVAVLVVDFDAVSTLLLAKMWHDAAHRKRQLLDGAVDDVVGGVAAIFVRNDEEIVTSTGECHIQQVEMTGRCWPSSCSHQITLLFPLMLQLQ